MNESVRPVKPKLLYCNRCGGSTNHLHRGSHGKLSEVDGGQNWEETIVTFWTCAGCEDPVLETQFTASGMLEENGEQYFVYAYEPPRTTHHHRAKVFKKLPVKLRVLYHQTVNAFNAELSVLCAAGLRALLEGICADKGVTGRNLAKKIDGLDAHLPKALVSNLHAFRFMGNEAVHELRPPKRQDLKIALEVSEDLLNFMYDLDYKASLLPQSSASKGGHVV